MKTLRQQILDRIKSLGGESSNYYDDFSDYDLLEDYESLLRAELENEMRHQNENDSF